jgi:hypothetical protein
MIDRSGVVRLVILLVLLSLGYKTVNVLGVSAQWERRLHHNQHANLDETK